MVQASARRMHWAADNWRQQTSVDLISLQNVGGRKACLEVVIQDFLLNLLTEVYLWQLTDLFVKFIMFYVDYMSLMVFLVR